MHCYNHMILWLANLLKPHGRQEIKSPKEGIFDKDKQCYPPHARSGRPPLFLQPSPFLSTSELILYLDYLSSMVCFMLTYILLKVRDHVFTFRVPFVTPNRESRTCEASAKYLLILRTCGLLFLMRADLLHPFLWTSTVVVLTQIRIWKL